MASDASKGTAFLGTFSNKSGSENANSQTTVNADAQDILQRSKGEDHTVSHRHRLSLRHYPADCPPLKVRWFYAVDSPKWKPSLSDQKRENPKPLPQPKKFVPFTPKDSQSVEHAFQNLCNTEAEREQAHYNQPVDRALNESVKVPVNEDYLFDVDINRRELGPSYWVGPVYEVRRGTWFFQEGSTIRPCEENLATQLEEGYLKVKPWRFENINQPLAQPLPASNGREQEGYGNPPTVSINETRKYRLFGSYMNSIVSYQDATTSLLTSDDFMSRVSTTVYQTLGGVAGTKLVRGFIETKKQSDAQDKKGSDQKSTGDSIPAPSGALPASSASATRRAADAAKSSSAQDHLPEGPAEMGPERALERRVSSLASTQDATELEEQARRQEEKEMEDSREADDEDREREIDHLVLVTHGIGQRLGLRLESVNFIHDVNVLRKTMKSVYKASPDLQALNSAFPDKQKNCRIQVLPVCWRHLLEFPYKKFGKTRKELDLADADALEDDIYPALSDITLESVPAVRNLISDLAVDVLLYQSKYCEHITSIVKQECNRIVELYKKRNSSFKGSVSLCGHSLGSAILFDILCSGYPEARKATHSGEKAASGASSFAFECEEFFCLGSPVALFQMLKGNKIAGRPFLQDEKSELPSELGEEDETVNATFNSKRQSANFSSGGMINESQFAVSVPRCRQLYNIFHPSDPVSYRMEPLISPAMSSLKPQPLPSVKRSIWTASGQSLSMIGSRVGQSVGSLWTNFTSGVASSLLNRSLGISSDESSSHNSSTRSQQRSSLQPNSDSLGDRSPTLIDPDIETLYEGFQKAKLRRQKADSDSKSEFETGQEDIDRGLRRLRLEDEKVRLLNSNGRVDYSIQEGAFDISLIASLASHLSYWSDEDVNHFMISQMLCRKRLRVGNR
ncbi:DDHD domain-containing protein [Aspergillus pseudodeflectus]|uniref:DDHD domain-containing protein n=1 Tax=Aspergillus pseudodeflectus TaxID=176178 RepID=A0ABR4KYL8_9EURO